MGSLKRFYRNALQNRHPFAAGKNEDRIHSLELESHLATVSYNDFTLTEAIRPSLELTIIPTQGYKYEYLLPKRKRQYSTLCPPRSFLAASISLENLFETFLNLLDPLGNIVNVILETSHGCTGTNCTGLRRDYIDLPILKSFLYDHEDLLLNDGCVGISVFVPKTSVCVRFDDHKLVLVYAKSLLPFEQILQQNGIRQNASMELITDAEHIHITRDEYVKRFKELRLSLGMDGSFSTAR